MKAIILAGGLGTRLRPLTENTPKPLLPIQNKPIMQHAIENLKSHNITEIIQGVSYHADKIKEHFKDGSHLGVKISYSIEDSPLGTGGAVKQAAKGITKPFLLIWGDNLMNVDINKLKEIHKRNNAQLTMTLTPRKDVEHFGVANLEGEKILSFVEKPKREEAPSNLINAGAFIVDPKALEVLPEGVSSIEKDCFEKLAKQGVVYAHKHEGYWHPTDTLEKYNKAEQEFNP
jgi:mannose-1-phosphate guanylyltransferase